MFYQFEMREAQDCLTFHILLQIMVIKQANSLLQPVLKFVHDRNMRYNVNIMRFGA